MHINILSLTLMGKIIENVSYKRITTFIQSVAFTTDIRQNAQHAIITVF